MGRKCKFASFALASLTFLANIMPATAENESDATLGLICRATISKVMGRDISIIEVSQVKDEMAYVEYLRKDDGKQWKYRCKVKRDRVIWSSVDLYGPGSGMGRWRTDEFTHFELTEREITIIEKYSDGSSTAESFPQ